MCTLKYPRAAAPARGGGCRRGRYCRGNVEEWYKEDEGEKVPQTSPYSSRGSAQSKKEDGERGPWSGNKEDERSLAESSITEGWRNVVIELNKQQRDICVYATYIYPKGRDLI